MIVRFMKHLKNIIKKKEEFIDNLFKEVQEYNKYLDSNKDRNILPFEEWRSNKYGE